MIQTMSAISEYHEQVWNAISFPLHSPRTSTDTLEPFSKTSICIACSPMHRVQSAY